MGTGGIVIQMKLKVSSREDLLADQWRQVKRALEGLENIYRNSVDPENNELGDLIDQFVMKVEFDSPLAVVH